MTISSIQNQKIYIFYFLGKNNFLIKSIKYSYLSLFHVNLKFKNIENGYTIIVDIKDN